MLEQQEFNPSDEVMDILSSDSPTKWELKYRILPFWKAQVVPVLDREYAQSDDKLEPAIREFICHTSSLVDAVESMLAAMPDTEQEWIDLKGPEYKTAD